jgi:hypothetical protein
MAPYHNSSHLELLRLIAAAARRSVFRFLGVPKEPLMQFVQKGGCWLLVDESAPEHACVIATLRSAVEVLALRTFCEHFLAGQAPGAFHITHENTEYTVTPLQDRGGKLSLRVAGGNGWLGRIETEFALPQSPLEGQAGQRGSSSD